ncbi:glucosidase [uncultured Paludibaculum sp.]|uniref:MGH1-like glycoside hydrolase domain-containing protein n=1 Tax=uncultured Paludibaculum sp. TaxID=1765020 RepID=UPI002AAA9D32|nr:glucosidase [uncultured Paludibaculum sp.]
MPSERLRLMEARDRVKHWKRWGPYLSERQWGTVREDYSPDGDAWASFPFEHSHLRAYRWGEDGLLGVSDNHQRLCFAVALWNGHDPILKERLYGLSNGQGNHGEDVKEVYFYLDSTPTHSYMKALYKYPQRAYPYDWLRRRAAELGLHEHEPEVWESGCFDENRYFDVFAEYAKADEDDLLIRLTVHNRGPEAAPLHLLPTLWFRNRWTWGRKNRPRPSMVQTADGHVEASEATMGRWSFTLEGAPPLLFTENETNEHVLYGNSVGGVYTKDAFHRRVVESDETAVNPYQTGTKMCGWYQFDVPPGGSVSVRLRLRAEEAAPGGFAEFDSIFEQRQGEADDFYCSLRSCELSDDARLVQRQAFAGLLWSKQFFHYVVEDWLQGDPATPKPPPERLEGRNSEWRHFFTDDILSMPDKWEYPWFAAWDLAFHMIPFAQVDAEFAKTQLQLLLREWYLHPNGQIPAYEWAFSDVNPPVHAWACYRVFKIDAKESGNPDYGFLERCFHKLLMNFTWWVNRKDSTGDNIFEGGFLGLDNIGVFDRSRPLPTGGYTEQSDGTSWMAMYSLNMLRIALELAKVNPTYEDIASKFLEHFLYIASAMNTLGGAGLWDDQDGFYYDRLRLPSGKCYPLRVRSIVGLIPLFAVETFDAETAANLDGFQRRTRWFLEHRRDLTEHLLWHPANENNPLGIIALIQPIRLIRALELMLDEEEFLSPYGIRSMSQVHRKQPFVMHVNGDEYRVDYAPAESSSRMFGGNSNWRGPIWFPLNYLLIESLQKFHHFFGDRLTVEFPTGSGNVMDLGQVATELSKRLSHLFLRDDNSRRPCYGDTELFQTNEHFRDYLFFHEYFHGDNGAGLGANHQTGWTALVAKLLTQSGE